jgi:hypothetical protein
MDNQKFPRTKGGPDGNTVCTKNRSEINLEHETTTLIQARPYDQIGVYVVLIIYIMFKLVYLFYIFLNKLCYTYEPAII